MDKCAFCGKKTDLIQCEICQSVGCELCVDEDGCPHCEDDWDRIDDRDYVDGSP